MTADELLSQTTGTFTI